MNEDRMSDAFVSARELAIDEQADLYDEGENEMTEQRNAQHFEASTALLKAHIDTLRQQLIERQLEEYPDSRIMSDDEVCDKWVDELSPRVMTGITRRCAEHAKRLKDAGFDEQELRETFRDDWAEAIRQEKAHVAACVLLCMRQNPVRVFYECGKQEDGTYRFRGCRYGVQGYEYASGFSMYSL